MGSKKSSPAARTEGETAARGARSTPRGGGPRSKSAREVYVLEVALAGGPITEEFARKNPAVSRTVEIRGSQTLEDLHEAIFRAFDREEDHLYEFRLGGRRPTPYDPSFRPAFCLDGTEDDHGSAEDAEIASLGLRARQVFYYWFDFGDDWHHEIRVLPACAATPGVGYPRITDRKGASPPQYPDMENEEEDDDEG